MSTWFCKEKPTMYKVLQALRSVKTETRSILLIITSYVPSTEPSINRCTINICCLSKWKINKNTLHNTVEACNLETTGWTNSFRKDTSDKKEERVISISWLWTLVIIHIQKHAEIVANKKCFYEEFDVFSAEFRDLRDTLSHVPIIQSPQHGANRRFEHKHPDSNLDSMKLFLSSSFIHLLHSQAISSVLSSVSLWKFPNL